MVVRMHPPIPHRDGPEGVAAMTQDVAEVFTRAFREHPADWHMMQRVFLEDLREPRAGDPGRG
jgi:KDO2-lipid IV(A) lauroyltransferase